MFKATKVDLTRTREVAGDEVAGDKTVCKVHVCKGCQDVDGVPAGQGQVGCITVVQQHIP